MTFYLSGMVAALHFDNCTAKASYVIKVVHYCFFLSRLACNILILVDKHTTTLIQAYVYTPLNVEAYYLLQGRLVPELHLLPHIAQAVFEIGGQQRYTC